MIGLTPFLLVFGGGCAAGVATRWIARRYIGEGTPSLYVFIALQVAVAGSAILASPRAELPLAMPLGWTLGVLGIVDALALRLPDVLTAPLALCGLGIAAVAPDRSLVDHLIGAAVGFGAFAALSAAYAALRGRDGLGLGDAKLLGCAGAWLGCRPLPLVVFAAALGGLAWAMVARLRHGKAAWRDPIPFGVPLALATWVGWLIAARETAL